MFDRGCLPNRLDKAPKMDTELRTCVANGTGKGLLRFGGRRSGSMPEGAPSQSDCASESYMFGHACSAAGPLASERAPTDRGPVGPSINEARLMINPWQTVPLLCVILR